MSVSIHVQAFRDGNDDKYKIMYKIHQLCIKADVSLPEEVDDYFDSSLNPEAPLEVDIPTTKWTSENELETGFEIYVKDIPEGVKKIRFLMSY